ncbi:hypothetical protein BY458DRAFT_500689 [Sporodiniella umbellata]|nr:hypothetical protein BY458DRAFT_500689 [Sporodiniella umbellata]
MYRKLPFYRDKLMRIFSAYSVRLSLLYYNKIEQMYLSSDSLFVLKHSFIILFFLLLPFFFIKASLGFFF